jgi:L-asparagine oxygenase
MNVSVDRIEWPGDTTASSAWISALTAALVEVPTSCAITADSRDSADETLVGAAGRLSGTLPAPVDAALIDFGDRSNRLGALLLTNVPVQVLPATPASPNASTAKDLASELTLLAVSRQLGQPVGYAPEHGGRIVQNLVPTREAADLQMSTSSSSNLMFHTETAFHPHRPRYLALHCLRGDPDAHTTLASVFDIVQHLPADERSTIVDAMFEPRFRTSVDASFLGGRADELGEPHALLTGTLDEPTFLFDADLTVGIDTAAQSVIEHVQAAINTAATSVILAPGDLLIIDNNRAVHGRSPFAARFDGTDRWLQRAFIVSDLAPSAADRRGRVIITQFGTDPLPA